MRHWLKWLFSSLNIKRWLALTVLAMVLMAVGLSGAMGLALDDFRVDVFDPEIIERVQRQVHSLRFVDFLLITLGVWGVWFGLRRFTFSLLALTGPASEKEFARAMAERARRRRGPKIVAIGGGTGLPNLLSGLKEYTTNLTAVVTMADDGGSSGRLRKDFDMPPPGDLRNCLVALAETEPLMASLFQHRFKQKGGLGGHSFGNLFIAALAEVTGDFNEAVRQSSRVLAIAGRVLPVTLEDVSLRATLDTGKVITGESQITRAGGKIERLELLPDGCTANPEVIKAIEEADAIVLGPGSLYTSILPNLLVPGVAGALSRSRAMKIYVCNVMTQPGETDHYHLSDHVRTLVEKGGPGLVNTVLANSEPPSPQLLERYQEEGQVMVPVDREKTLELGVRVVKARLLDQGEYLRHSPRRLARSIVRLLVT